MQSFLAQWAWDAGCSECSYIDSIRRSEAFTDHRQLHPTESALQSAVLAEQAMLQDGTAVLRGRESRGPLGRPGRRRRSASALRLSAAAAADGWQGGCVGWRCSAAAGGGNGGVVAACGAGGASGGDEVGNLLRSGRRCPDVSGKKGGEWGGMEADGADCASKSKPHRVQPRACSREKCSMMMWHAVEPGQSRAAPSRRST